MPIIEDGAEKKLARRRQRGETPLALALRLGHAESAKAVCAGARRRIGAAWCTKVLPHPSRRALRREQRELGRDEAVALAGGV